MKLVILGGGTAGWLTALFMRKLNPSATVTLIENSKIGVIGVGEATTPNIVSFLKHLHIDPLDLVKYAEATIKLGISFENWNGDQKKYFHPFGDLFTECYINGIVNSFTDSAIIKKVINQKLNLNDYLFCNKIAYQNKVDIEKIAYALHFNAGLVAKFLEETGRNRRISVIDGLFQSVNLDENGFITSIFLEGGQTVDCDFVFDCSGLARLLVGSTFENKWISYQKWLPMKTAIPFWLESTDEIKPYTTATAMSNGWIWQTPLQSRIGSGYVFDSDYITVDQAHQEAEQFFNQKLDIRKIINFDAGRFEKTWIKNCCAFGLSSSFVEPLESTSIFSTINHLILFSYFFNEIGVYDPVSIDHYNRLIGESVDNIRDFIYLHYLTKRNDSNFWKNFRKNHPAPDHFYWFLEKLKDGNTRAIDLDARTGGFQEYSYLVVAYGLDFIEKPINVNNLHIKPSIAQYKTITTDMSTRALPHTDFLNSITSK